ncbi:MAG: transposase [Lachnospiraceae bacterium]|nr:transposase [Lachnospiraceae bacterium]MDD7664819.1 transposase [Lachnospiraceae bacterium]MDY4164696.1 transposase [Lachnospiraceae bacterium]
MNQDNSWIKLADQIPWDTFEAKYAELFPSDTGNVAKPLRMALGALIIQTKFQYSDRELVEQIAENPYLQYFIGLPGFREEALFDASTLVLFRKRISAEMLMEVNEYLLVHKGDDKDNHTHPSGGKTSADDTAKEDTYKGTLTLDATCALANIRYPQDISLLNEAREKLETLIYHFCKCYGLKLRKYARKEYLAFAKSKKLVQKLISVLQRAWNSVIMSKAGKTKRYSKS